jgi:hypothetical protein
VQNSGLNEQDLQFVLHVMQVSTGPSVVSSLLIVKPGSEQVPQELLS